MIQAKTPTGEVGVKVERETGFEPATSSMAS